MCTIDDSLLRLKLLELVADFTAHQLLYDYLKCDEQINKEKRLECFPGLQEQT